eukprot:m.299238 g.299238  ORF g.299238 m.299238 type:complete len:115 (-) comp281658_c0_seq1:105-449(-)
MCTCGWWRERICGDENGDDNGDGTGSNNDGGDSGGNKDGGDSGSSDGGDSGGSRGEVGRDDSDGEAISVDPSNIIGTWSLCLRDSSTSLSLLPRRVVNDACDADAERSNTASAP